MNKPLQIPKILTVSLLFFISKYAYSQSFTDALRLKLPKTDQYKIIKAQTFYTQGKSYLLQAQEFADSIHLKENLNTSHVNLTDLNEYYSGRIKASYCFRNSNGLLFGVLDKHIKEFWKKHPEEKMSLDMILKMENAAYDSLELGDKLRARAERKYSMEDKIPLVTQAENTEEKALFTLDKVLYIYLNWPTQPNMAWLYSDNTADPYQINQQNVIPLSSIQLDTITILKDTIHKATSIYALMHISENQIDNFNEFLKARHPDKMESYLIDFQKLYDIAIDSLHREWRKYLTSGIVAPDTLKPALSPNDTNITPGVNDFRYKLQIAASRVKIGYNELQKQYSGNEKISELYEDNWFKYTIGSYQTYNDPRTFRDEWKSKVQGIFVIAYYNGKRIKITTSLIKKKQNAGN